MGEGCYRAAVKSRGAGGIAETGAPVEHMLTRGAALALDGAGALHTLSPEGTGSACPLCQAASAGAAGAEPPHPFPPAAAGWELPATHPPHQRGRSFSAPTPERAATIQNGAFV